MFSSGARSKSATELTPGMAASLIQDAFSIRKTAFRLLHLSLRNTNVQQLTCPAA